MNDNLAPRGVGRVLRARGASARQPEAKKREAQTHLDAIGKEVEQNLRKSRRVRHDKLRLKLLDRLADGESQLDLLLVALRFEHPQDLGHARGQVEGDGDDREQAHVLRGRTTVSGGVTGQVYRQTHELGDVEDICGGDETISESSEQARGSEQAN